MKILESILVATGLSERSDDAKRAAGALAALTGARLHVLHSFDFQSLPYSDANVGHATFEGRIAETRQALADQLRRTVRPGVDVASQEVMIYAAHRAILEYAEAVRADLVVMGPHRRHARADAFLGSTADRVIRTVGAPCLVVRGPLSLPLRNVIVPLDLSEPALGALDVALAWSNALRPREEESPLGPRLTVLHVIPRVFDAKDFPFERAMVGPELDREVEAAIRRASAEGSLDVREEICWGDRPAEEILRAAEQERTDLLVLATHGHGALKRALIGSVASGVARGASCPVLLVPPAMWNAEPAGTVQE
jgi:nucleotide-binding universal stress UspA family protein